MGQKWTQERFPQICAVLSAFDAPLENSMRGRQIIGFIFLFVPGCVYTALPGLAQSQNTGFVHSGVTVSFENTSDYAVGAVKRWVARRNLLITRPAGEPITSPVNLPRMPESGFLPQAA